MYAMLYGALPLVRRTGGLADTVTDAGTPARSAGTATGFVFDAALAADLEQALERVFTLWRNVTAWRTVQHRAMSGELGWSRPAARYLALYRELRPQA